MRVELTPRLPDQELLVGTRYWEGAVTVVGSAAGRPLSGTGYVELVGYGENDSADRDGAGATRER
jgi:predicted secreted hydrolase